MVLVANAHLTMACDYCNCYLGLNPHYKKNSVGLRYYYMSYTGSHNTDAELEFNHLTKKDFWETRTDIELHGQYYPTQKLQLLFSVPYVINTEGVKQSDAPSQGARVMHDAPTQTTTTHINTETVQGFGDPLLLVHYQLFNKTAGDSTHFSERMFVGGGIKIPLGDYKIAVDEEAHERLHKPGTGSWDVLASITYLGKIRRFGLNANLSYLLSTKNNQQFKFGNRFNANAIIYFALKYKHISFYPSVGGYFEGANKDKDVNGEYLNNSGGNITYAHAGLDFYFKKISLTIAYQLPVLQILHQPQPKIKNRVVAGISYVFH